MRTFKYLALFVGQLLFAACEKDITFDLPDPEPRLALISHFTEGRLFSATLNRSHSIGDTSFYAPPGGSVVQVLSNGLVIDSLVEMPDLFSGQSVWIGQKSPQPGVSYRICAKAPGYPEARGESRLPDTAVEPLLTIAPQAEWKWQAGQQEIPVRIRLPQGFPSQNRFFAFQLESYTGFYDVTPTGFHLVDSFQTPFSVSGALVDGGLLTYSDRQDGLYLVDDISWNNDDLEIRFSVGVHDDQFSARPLCLKLYWRTLSPEYYHYIWSIHRQDLYSLFNEPNVIFNNISGGVGNVGAYRQVLLAHRFP